ncbi:acyltransferase domain-containing protein [Streptomyces sp. DH37]|uniref:acyltransferase domain-containing protein n=1 Tax=Streptomyces sp. DH37 TaxID=3040122 RepID=UPI002441EC6F|nr:acyltransferase domain-containing protein [Streptomyces sp. DH37]MDG9704709.1 acyltransferase domain-containing protein [Streptomyces sp. DH37]
MSVLPRKVREQAYADWLSERLAHYLERPVEEAASFVEHGLDSVAALSLYGDIEEEFGPLIDPTDIWAYPTVRALARYLALRDPRPGGDGRVRAAFVFTGQGSQHPGMTSGLYLHSTGYRTHLDEAADALLPYTGLSVVDLILSGDRRIHQTAFTQPALFAVEYALARTLEESGVRPVAVLGHGIGEFAAAAVAGALTLEAAAQMVALRGAFMQYLPSGGGMMATCAPAYEAAELLSDEPGVSIGAVNAAKATVLSGEIAGLERVQEKLAARGVAATMLNVTHAFHSPLMDPVLPRFETVARRLPGGAPRIPYYSTVRGGFTTEPLYVPYWSRQITSTVRFADAARHLLAQQTPTHVVEIGPKAVLTPFLRRMGGSRGPVCLPMCRGPETNAVDLAGVLSVLDAGPLSAALAED